MEESLFNKKTILALKNNIKYYEIGKYQREFLQATILAGIINIYEYLSKLTVTINYFL